MGCLVKEVDFLFVYEVRNRELDSICLLGAWLEKKGYRVAYVNSWDNLYNFRPEYRTKVAVIPACYTSGAYTFFTGQQALSFEKAVDLQWEQVLVNMVTQSTVQTGWDFRGEALETRHVSWGENNRDYVHGRYGMGLDKLRVCGYLPLDFYREELRAATADRAELFTRYSLDPEKKTVLFISSFAEAGKPESELELLDGDRNELMENIRLQEKSQETILAWFRKLAKEDGSLQIVYRPHPAEANKPEFAESTKGLPNFHVIGGESIRNWILNCDILCNWQSTSMIELYAAGKPTLILRPAEIPFRLAIPIFEEGHYTAVRTYEELAEGIRAERADFPIEKDLLLRFYSITDRPAYERVGQYLIETMEDDGYHSKDIGNHLTAKGRILCRLKDRFETGKVKVVKGIYGMLGKPLPKKRQEETDHYLYYEQKMKQNRITPKELRTKLDAYKAMIPD